MRNQMGKAGTVLRIMLYRHFMTEGKRNIIHQLLREYDIRITEDVLDALKDLLDGTIKEMMEAEMDGHLGYEKSERFDSDDSRNSYKGKRVNSSYGSMENTRMKEAIAATFPKTEYQRCLVHQVRNTRKYVLEKDRKAFTADLKTAY